MESLIPQRVITISITGTDGNAQVTYTYVSPVTKQPYKNSPICDMVCNQPTYSLFVLDFDTCAAGWTITGTTPRSPTGELLSTPGPVNLSILTFNSYTFDGTFNFYINYFNMLTQQRLSIDPQEGNIPRG